MQILPWQQELWTRLQSRRREGNLPHAMLLAGAAGLGKLDFAQSLAQSLLCDQPGEEGSACNDCQGCHLFRAGAHTDFMSLAVAEDKTVITVLQARELIDFMHLTRSYSHHKIGLVIDAERMHRPTANALLKTIEEPPAWSVIMLVSSEPSLLPATIRSRCQRLAFNVPPRQQAESWLAPQVPDQDAALLLAVTQGRPLAALALGQSEGGSLRRDIFDGLADLLDARLAPEGLAKRWKDHSFESLTSWMLSWLRDVIRVRFLASAGQLDNPDYHDRLQGLAKGLDLESLFQMVDETQRARRLSNSSLNKALMLESLVLTWYHRFAVDNRSRQGSY